MTDTANPFSPFGKFVPGFDFLQNLAKGAGAALPAVGQWVAPTLDPAELEKRIGELRTVQFWLEQNARMLSVTIQALEVQRMTLSTLKTMNVSLGDLTESLKIKLPDAAAAAPAPAPWVAASAAPAPAPAATAPSEPEAKAKPAVDPMQWWGALTQQFTELASKAMSDGAGDAARHLAGSMVKQGIDAAGQSLSRAAAMPAAAVKSATEAAASGMAGIKKAAAKTATQKTAAKPAASAGAARTRKR